MGLMRKFSVLAASTIDLLKSFSQASMDGL